MTNMTQDIGNEIVKALQEMQLDIREIKTSMKHSEQKFDRVHSDMNDLKVLISETAHDAESAIARVSKVEDKCEGNGKNIDRLFEKFREKEKEDSANKKWLYGTMVTVIGLIISFVTFLQNYIF